MFECLTVITRWLNMWLAQDNIDHLDRDLFTLWTVQFEQQGKVLSNLIFH